MEAVVQGCVEGARQAAAEPQTDPAVYQRKRDLALELMRLQLAWLAALERPLHDALRDLRVGRRWACARPWGLPTRPTFP